MPDDPQVLRGIDWKSAFPFTLIFRSFRVAVHPSKLVLALIAVLLIYIGGRVLDGIWPARWLATPNELQSYVATRGYPDASQEFATRRAAERKQIEDNYQAQLQIAGKPDGGLGDIKNNILKQRQDKIDQANAVYNQVLDANKPDAVNARDLAIADAYRTASQQYKDAQAINGVGLFVTFLGSEMGIANMAFQAGASGRWLGAGGVLGNVVDLLAVVPAWAIRHHPLYFTLFGIYCLIIWAIFGGAIARIAAVQVARDEKISFRQALSFSTAKFLSFVSAPIIPMAIVLAIGLVVAVVAFVLFNVPYLSIVGGALFFLALAAGFVMTLVLIGLVGGFNLMYPTIAVEGSDSFDAISRSFSYLFARPWRLVFYSIVAAVYGAICYTFVRYFILIMLGLTHTAVGSGIFRSAPNNQPLLPTMWPNPLTAPTLSYPIDHLTLNVGDDITATLMAIWIYLTIAMLGAFAISFYFSANTIIYMLMRHEVDATELDDVYVEQTDDDFVETMGTEPTTGATEPATTATTSGETTSAGA